jgi:hypothetical protein
MTPPRTPTLAAARLTPLLLLALLVGCESPTTNSGLATVPVRIGSKSFTLEVADKPSTQQFGLMRRDSLPSDRGMLFVFPREEERSFWMKDVRFPLDIIFVNAAGRVVSVKRMKAYDRNSTLSDGPAQFAIELNEGAATSAGVQPGMTLKLPDGLHTKPD